MKIVDRKTFLALPAGVLFYKYEEGDLEELCIKTGTGYMEGSSAIGDFYYDVVGQPFFETDLNGKSGYGSQTTDTVLITVEYTGVRTPDVSFNYTGRDGCFDADQLFLVFEERDRLSLLKRLSDTQGAEIVAAKNGGPQ